MAKSAELRETVRGLAMFVPLLYLNITTNDGTFICCLDMSIAVIVESVCHTM